MDLRADIDPPVLPLKITSSFAQLSKQEKFYAHYLAQAAFAGTRVTLAQVSPESKDIFDLILELYHQCGGRWQSLVERHGPVGEHSLNFLLDYGAMVLENLGNYRGYGDRKFVPNLPLQDFWLLCQGSEKSKTIFARVSESVYSVQPAKIGLPSEGWQSMYYPESPNLSANEIKIIQDHLLANGHYLQNTRLRKRQGEPGTVFEVITASVEQKSSPEVIHIDDLDANIIILYGDYSTDLASVCTALEMAIPFASNQDQKSCIQLTISSLRTGNIEDHKEASRIWRKDPSPTVESANGFLEPYRDPMRLRCEWSALVAIQDRQQTSKFIALTNRARGLIAQMPWIQRSNLNDDLGPFEREAFVQPDFAALHILAWCTTNIFTGISLPNYQDLKFTIGRKNITLSNRASAASQVGPIPFVSFSEQKRFLEARAIAFDVILAGHELIGHGCGKLLQEVQVGEYNFDMKKRPINPLTGQEVSSWYKFGETQKSLFGRISTGYEECVAESIGLYLSSDPHVLDTLVGGSMDHDTVKFASYMVIITQALRGLLSYEPSTQQWGQSHDQARFAILKCLVMAGDEFVTIDSTSHPSPPDLTIRIDESKINQVGRKALAEMLLNMHIYRSTADVQSGTAFFMSMTKVDGVYLRWREAVVRFRQPRAIFLQSNTFIERDNVVLKEYPATKEGLIQSWAERTRS